MYMYYIVYILWCVIKEEEEVEEVEEEDDFDDDDEEEQEYKQHKKRPRSEFIQEEAGKILLACSVILFECWPYLWLNWNMSQFLLNVISR